MKQLFIIRHAEAERADGIADFDRALTLKGIADVKNLAKAMKSAMHGVDVVLASAAMRTSQTAEQLVAGLGLGKEIIRESSALYMADAHDIIKMLGELPSEIRSVVVVGHNPTMYYLACSLMRKPVDRFPKAGLVMLKFSSSSWHDISPSSLIASNRTF